MLEYFIRGEMRISTFLHLLSQYWTVLGAFLLLVVLAVIYLINKFKSKGNY